MQFTKEEREKVGGQVVYSQSTLTLGEKNESGKDEAARYSGTPELLVISPPRV